MKSQRIVLAAHCVLNQNSVVEGWARARGAYPVAALLVEEGAGILQLPCPELIYGGLDRPPLEVEDYDTEEYRELCRGLLLPYVRQLAEYARHGYAILGVIGIGNSPTCSFGGVRGVMADVLVSLLEREGLAVPFVDIPEDYREGTEDAAVDEKIKTLLRSCSNETKR